MRMIRLVVAMATVACLATTASAQPCGGGPVEFETNSPLASLDINGQQGSAFCHALTNLVATCGPAPGVLNMFTTGNLGANYEIVLSYAPPVGLTSGAPVIPLGTPTEIVNISIVSNISYLNGGVGIILLPMPGSGLTIGFGISSPLNVTIQGVVTASSVPAGFELTQPNELIVTLAPGTSGSVIAGNFDDLIETVNVTTAPFCPGPVTFYGTTYTNLEIDPNGRVQFGNPANAWSPSVALFLSGMPSVGLWTDFSPNVNGTVTVTSPAPDIIRVDWVGVPYFGQPATSSSFGIQFDNANGVVSIDNLASGGVSNIQAGPTENFLLGISPGAVGGATDPFAGVGLTFTVNSGTNVVAAPTDVWYDFAPLGPNAQLASLASGVLVSIIFAPDGSGNYLWAGQ